MADWADTYRAWLEARYGTPPDAASFRARFAWMEDLHAKARELLTEEALAALPPPEIYAHLRELSVPRCPIRVANLGRVNDAAGVVESLRRLVSAPGDFEAKLRAAKIPQAGRVTIGELLCVLKPHRFPLRNTAFHRAAARVVPFYTKRGLEELPDPEFLDLARELTRIQERWLAETGLGPWAKQYRFLLLYAVLTEPAAHSKSR